MAPEVPVSASKSALLKAIGLHEDSEYDERIYRSMMVCSWHLDRFSLFSKDANYMEPHLPSEQPPSIYYRHLSQAQKYFQTVFLAPNQRRLTPPASCTYLPFLHFPAMSLAVFISSPASIHFHTAISTCFICKGNRVPRFPRP